MRRDVEIRLEGFGTDRTTAKTPLQVDVLVPVEKLAD